jgi:hypothetical protein
MECKREASADIDDLSMSKVACVSCEVMSEWVTVRRYTGLK